ncbi:MAG: hypothetical protein HFG26_03305 [Provencibacterium sp.]|nr:hypothetical protein [Provencibacterium sp.]
MDRMPGRKILLPEALYFTGVFVNIRDAMKGIYVIFEKRQASEHFLLHTTPDIPKSSPI